MAIWAGGMAAASPRRFCRHVRLTDWQLLNRGETPTGTLLLMADPMWLATACALSLFHGSITLVADRVRVAEVGGLPASQQLSGQLHHLASMDVDGLRKRLNDGETVVWLLGSEDFRSLGTEGERLAWASLVAGTEILWAQAKMESEAGLRISFESISTEEPSVSLENPDSPDDPATSMRKRADAVRAKLRRSLAEDPLSFPWEHADAFLVREHST